VLLYRCFEIDGGSYEVEFNYELVGATWTIRNSRHVMSLPTQQGCIVTHRQRLCIGKWAGEETCKDSTMANHLVHTAIIMSSHLKTTKSERQYQVTAYRPKSQSAGAGLVLSFI
jgi:hypothetical protein